jgi:hypothetical protein
MKRVTTALTRNSIPLYLRVVGTSHLTNTYVGAMEVNVTETRGRAHWKDRTVIDRGGNIVGRVTGFTGEDYIEVTRQDSDDLFIPGELLTDTGESKLVLEGASEILREINTAGLGK